MLVAMTMVFVELKTLLLSIKSPSWNLLLSSTAKLSLALPSALWLKLRPPSQSHPFLYLSLPIFAGKENWLFRIVQQNRIDSDWYVWNEGIFYKYRATAYVGASTNLVQSGVLNGLCASS